MRGTSRNCPIWGSLSRRMGFGVCDGAHGLFVIIAAMGVDDRLCDDGDFAVGIILARWSHRNLYVLRQSGKKIHKALDGETA